MAHINNIECNEKWTIFSCVTSSFVAVSSGSLGSGGTCGHFDDWGPVTVF